MYIVPEKELYTLIQLFYAGHHEQLAAMELDAELDFSNPLYRLEAMMYQARSNVILGDAAKATEVIESAMSDLQEAIASGLVDSQSGAYVKDEFTSLANFITKSPINPSVEDTLGSMFKYLQDGTLSGTLGENLELLVFNSIIKGEDKAIKAAKESMSDALILDFACAWLGLSSDDEFSSVKGSYYFFDELCSSSNTSNDKSWTCLMISHLKMGHIQEAEECLSHIKQGNEFSIICQISIASIKGDDAIRRDLTAQLAREYPNSGYVKDINEKNVLFDQVVASF